MSLTRRAQPVVVLDTTAPVIVNGRPTQPTYHATSSSSSTGIRGKSHIHVVPLPDPVTQPGGRVTTPAPPKTGPWHARWSVHTLPAPGNFNDGYYWLGAASTADGTSGIATACRSWQPDPSTPHAPHWHSVYPFKPSVAAVDHYLFGGDVVHHPKGVNFNAQFIEHMWMDWGSPHPQPFTWLIAGVITAYHGGSYHHLLDSGRDPNDIGVPRYSADDCYTDRTLHEDVGYRTSLAVNPQHMVMRTHEDAGGLTAHCPVFASFNPRMFIGIFNGGSSYVGAYSPLARRLRKGSINNGAGYRHRFYALGRQHGVLSQDLASHMLLFDIRIWNRALTRDELDEQYDQISTTHQFDRYRRT